MAPALRLFLLTALAMIAFAANSVLTRIGLAATEIGPSSFTAIRLLSGAAILFLLCQKQSKAQTGSWRGAFSLSIYMVFFTFAYLALPAGTGAVILFAMVQITMLGWGLAKGERLSGLQWFGFGLALAALIWLVSPSVEAPPLIAALSMAVSGIGWGAYSLIGRGAGDSLVATAGNFQRASLLSIPVLLIAILIVPEPTPPADGIVLAVVSGAVTSGIGYAIWYLAVKDLSATRAGIAQLTVPALAAAGGVMFLAEPITLRFTLATSAILGGVALAVLTPAQRSSKAGG